ncbi:DUF6177 family protein [Streptomonospora litoralis]|uniref:DUF6177 family protein n=1 Tax=Streptomonospora litoralis TaxID=2498135 RepID=UPI001F6231D3|nr:DUF6177 family protein [Streptomonospora litoralis]
MSEFGGCVWAPEPELQRDDPRMVGSTEHPAVTLATDHVAVAVQDRPVVPFSPWLADAVATHGRAGRGFQLVTPAASRLTHEVSALLENPMARWVVRAPDGGYYDGHVGLPVTWHEQVGFVRDAAGSAPGSESAEPALHPHFLHPDPQDGADAMVDHLLVDLHLLHAPDEHLRLGAETELLTRAVAGAAPVLWGTAEPVPMLWNRDDVTALARRRAPNNSRFLFRGPPGAARPLSGTLSVSRVEEGVKESVALAVAHPPGALPDLDAVTGLVEELAAGGALHSVEVNRRRGRADLTRAPHPTGPVIPVGFGVGTDAVQTIGLQHARSAPVEPVRFGPRLTPSLWYRLGDGTDPEDRQRARDLLSHLRPEGS